MKSNVQKKCMVKSRLRAIQTSVTKDELVEMALTTWYTPGFLGVLNSPGVAMFCVFMMFSLGLNTLGVAVGFRPTVLEGASILTGV